MIFYPETMDATACYNLLFGVTVKVHSFSGPHINKMYYNPIFLARKRISKKSRDLFVRRSMRESLITIWSPLKPLCRSGACALLASPCCLALA